MQHIGTRPLETERLILRRYTAGDAQEMFDHWACDPEVTKYLTWQAHESEEITNKISTIDAE